jgi:7,8-dihydropterin-6-yl-methyl-4-(beta-D-ribofuranosyl)aminobenzene 5'-phosphate synthase
MTEILLLATLSAAAFGQESKRITILYDAFGPPSKLVRDWGYAALVEYGGKRVLFDTGNDAKKFEHNVRTLGVDLRKLDAAVISHRHGDHTSGIAYLLKVNPKVRIFTPLDPGIFHFDMPRGFLEPHGDLPNELRYFGGEKPARFATGHPWAGANFTPVTQPVEVVPGMTAFTTRSEKPGTAEMNELSLAIRTPKGLAVLVGCSHPGVEKILARARELHPVLHLVAGGFHLVMTPKEEVERVAGLLRGELHVERVAPGHCTSELGIATFRGLFGRRFVPAGLGERLELP